MDEEIKFLQKQIREIAKEFGWQATYLKEEKQLIAFRNAAARCHIEIYLRSRRVITCMQHPKGASILERNGLGISDIRKIFEDPRVHTGTGKRLDTKINSE